MIETQEACLEPWHTLIILDACRYDCFEEICLPHLSGILKPRWSPASCTAEWLKILKGDFTDTVYVSGNPYASQDVFESPRFNYRIPWPFGGEEALWDWGWDERLGTVPPEAFPIVVKRYTPAQRMIIHMMQPHHPFIYDGKRIFTFDKDHGWADTRHYVKGDQGYPEIYTEWQAVQDGLVSEAEVITAYKKTLEGAIPALQEIIAHRSEGMTIITADHGELFEPPYSHPCESDHPDLHTVPWMVVGSAHPTKGGDHVSKKQAVGQRGQKMSKKKSKIDGDWYDHAYWETSQKGGKGGYDSIASLDGLSREIAEQTVEVFDLKGKCLLDAGCGPGLMVARYRELGVEAWGIDWSSYALEGGAKVRLAVKEFCILGSITDLSQWDDNVFDMIRSTQVLEHIPSSDIPQVAKEFARVLKPGGILLIDMPICSPWEEDPRPDAREPSHVSVRKIEYWNDWFGGVGLLIWQDAVIRFITEAEVWKKVRWQMLAYYKPASDDIPITPTPDDGEKV